MIELLLDAKTNVANAKDRVLAVIGVVAAAVVSLAALAWMLRP